MSDDFTREINRALSDLEGNAPKAPRLSDITTRRAVLMTTRPQRWSTPMIAFAAAAVTIVIVGVAVLVGSTLGGDAEPAATDIYGVWIVEAFTIDGQTTTMDAAGFDPEQQSTPYVEITHAVLEGDTGCNAFGSQQPPEYSGGRLVAGDVFSTLAGCLDIAEPPLLEALGATGEVGATVTGDTMTWTTDTIEIQFRRADQIPAPTVRSWPSSEGRLNCSPGFVLSVDIPGSGVVTAPDLLTAIDDVVEVEGEGVLGSGEPFAWGLDADGVIIAGAAPGDIEPPVIHVWACTEQFGLRPEVDPAGAVLTWVNMLGLGQASQQVWGNRFPELCQTLADKLPGLAEGYIQEDAPFSLRQGGALPSVEEATSALEVMQLSTCAVPVTETATALPPTTLASEASCSSLGMDGPADPASFDGLPEAVAATRQWLLTSAIACDFDDIVGLGIESGPANDGIFWGAGRSVETLVEYDQSGASLKSLVIALTTLPYSREEGQRVDQSSGETVPDIYYMWPPASDFGNGGSVADAWDQETLEAVAALNGETVDELIGLSREFGGYAGFRVGIAEDGRWLFALAGD